MIGKLAGNHACQLIRLTIIFSLIKCIVMIQPLSNHQCWGLADNNLVNQNRLSNIINHNDGHELINTVHVQLGVS